MDNIIADKDILKAEKDIFDFVDKSDNEIVHDSYFGKIIINIP